MWDIGKRSDGERWLERQCGVWREKRERERESACVRLIVLLVSKDGRKKERASFTRHLFFLFFFFWRCTVTCLERGETREGDRRERTRRARK